MKNSIFKIYLILLGTSQGNEDALTHVHKRYLPNTEIISTIYRNIDIISMPAELLTGSGWDRNVLLSTKQHFYCTH